MSDICVNRTIPVPAGATIDDLIADYYRKVKEMREWYDSHLPWKDDLTEEEKARRLEIKGYESYLDDFEVNYPTYSHIFDTEYRWDIPYLIDVEKYKAVVSDTRLSDEQLKSLKLSGSIWASHCDRVLNFVFDTFVSYYDENNGCCQYDCCQWCEDDGPGNYEGFKAKVLAVTGCIIGVDTKAVDKLIVARAVEMENLSTEIERLKSIKHQGISRGAENDDLEAILKENDKP